MFFALWPDPGWSERLLGAARGPMSQGDGRDHHIKGFSYMVAGGGMKGGISYGATDDLGYAAEENPVSVHDFHATLL